jgi:CO dehydrogenase nickel-insertion accessory protein CooC1
MKTKLNKHTSRDEHIIGKIKNNKAIFEYEFKKAKIKINQKEVEVIINNEKYEF